MQKIIVKTVVTKGIIHHLLVDVISKFIKVVMTDFGTDTKYINITAPKINLFISLC
jgi:hypothetical protein